MVWFQRRSSMTLKARTSTFDTLEGRRSSSFDTIAVLPGNRPMAPPAVVEEVAPGLSNQISDEPETQRPRRSKGRFFGLMLRLPLFGSKDEKRTGPPKLTTKSAGIWRQCQTASDNSDDERVLSQRQSDARARLMSERLEVDGGGEGGRSQPSNRLVTLSLPLYRRTLEHRASCEIACPPLSMDVASGLHPGDPRVVPFRGAKVPNLGTVEEGLAGVGGKPRNSRESRSGKWTERASRQFSNVANRLRRKSRELRRKSRENDPRANYPFAGRASADYPGARFVKRRADLDRRNSMGAAMGGSGEFYDTPGPEGPRCPPDNLYIPSGPPDSIFVPTGEDDHSRSIESPMAQIPVVSSDSRSETIAPVHANRWPYEADCVLSTPLAIWDHEGNPIEQDMGVAADQGLDGADVRHRLSSAADQGLEGADFRRPMSSAAGYRSGESRGLESADFRHPMSSATGYRSVDSWGLEGADFSRPQSSVAAWHSGEGQGMDGSDFRRPFSSAADYHSGSVLAASVSPANDPVSEDSMMDSQGSRRRRGLDVSRSGEQLPPRQSPLRRAPVEWDYESGGTPCRSSNNSSEVASGGSHARCRKPRKDTMAMKIFGATSYADATTQLCHFTERGAPLAPSVDSEPTPRPQTPLSDDLDGEGSPARVSAEPKQVQHTLHVPSRCTPESCSPLEHRLTTASVECWNLPWDDTGKKTAGSVTQSEYDDGRPFTRPSISLMSSDDARPPVRPSISLSEDARPRPSISLSDNQYRPQYNRHEASSPDDGRPTGNCSAASFRGRDHVDVTVTYSSDGPLYHRSMLYQSGFSSDEESDDDIDDARYTPSQFVLKLKPKHSHRRWHSDCMKGISAVHDDYDDAYRSPSHYTLDRMERLSDIRSDYTRSYEGYPARPGYSFRSGYESDLFLPEFRNFGEREMHDAHGDELEKKPRKTWLDEMQETADLRRKECTYRIACQRAILQNMKETLQASKLAFDRIKSGLCPQLTSKVTQLRRRWGGKRRAERREQLVKALKREEDNIWDDFPLPVSGCGLLRSSPNQNLMVSGM